MKTHLPSLWLVAAVLGISWPVSAKGFKLHTIEDKPSGVSFLAPEGWSVEKDASQSTMTSPDGLAILVVRAFSTSGNTVMQLLEKIPGVTMKEVRDAPRSDWTCGEGFTNNKKFEVAACAREVSGVILLVTLRFDPKKYPKMDAPGLVKGVGASAKGFQAPPATKEPQEGENGAGN